LIIESFIQENAQQKALFYARFLILNCLHQLKLDVIILICFIDSEGYLFLEQFSIVYFLFSIFKKIFIFVAYNSNRYNQG